jgi:cell wall-associated NlpC family hydrolase
MELLQRYALSFVGVPYIWGGESPMHGYDCSGLVQEILRSVGLDPPGDQTAHMLWDHFRRQGGAVQPQLGALAFYGDDTRIKHIAFCLDDHRVLEAGGGNSKCQDVEDAKHYRAFVRVRPFKRRRDYLECLMPPYPAWVWDRVTHPPSE